MPDQHISATECVKAQKDCQKEMDQRFLHWRTFALVFGIMCALIVGAYGYTWLCFMTGAGRATVSEGKAAEQQRSVDKMEGRETGTALTLVDVKDILKGIQHDLKTVENAVNKLEARNQRMDKTDK
jgi:Mg2+/citrate symporter